MKWTKRRENVAWNWGESRVIKKFVEWPLRQSLSTEKELKILDRVDQAYLNPGKWAAWGWVCDLPIQPHTVIQRWLCLSSTKRMGQEVRPWDLKEGKSRNLQGGPCTASVLWVARLCVSMLAFWIIWYQHWRHQSSWCAWDWPSYITESPRSWETPQFWANWHSWSP